ncbi:DUF2993 family protein [Kribbella sp. VKM Ac-2527]|uniref:DUF2993 family protein n=2 Tax=Kribbella caucasensis TaxID=2512215 RepID=A0A4R6KAQ6_9ACTN|nr:DUF2993 family protein [Kribbella sp. VKM Ac-2527]
MSAMDGMTLMGSRRPRRWFRRLVVTVVLLALLGVGVDRAAEWVAEDQLATRAQAEAAKYDVQSAGTSAKVEGFGFLPQLAREKFDGITLDMREPTYSSVQAEDLSVAMTGVHVPRALLTGDGGTVRVDSADLTLRMSPDALSKVASGLDGLTLRIADGRLEARLEVRGVDVVASVRPQVQNGRIGLVVGDTNVPTALKDAVSSLLARGIKVPQMPFGASLRQVAVDGQSVVLTATATNLQLQAA